MSAYAFSDIALIIGSATVAVMSLTALVTVLLRRKAEKPVKPWLKDMLAGMAHADACKGRLNPARLPMQRM